MNSEDSFTDTESGTWYSDGVAWAAQNGLVQGYGHGRFGPTSNEYVPIEGDYYGIPYRSLLPVGVENLLLAGRCVSADSTAAGAIRVMPPCMGMGQAAGTAAALAVKQGVTPRALDAQALRRRLREDKAFL